MTRRRHVRKGLEFLRGVCTRDIRQKYRKSSGKLHIKYNAARLRRKGHSFEDIAEEVGRSVGTVFNWLYRMDQKGLDAVDDRKSPGRPPKISKEKQEELKEDLCHEPTRFGYVSGIWTARMVADRVLVKYGVKYCPEGALAMAHRLGFTVRMPRPVPYNTPPPEIIAKYVSDTTRALDWYCPHGYTLLCMDSAAVENSPKARRGLRPAGGRDTVGISYSKKSLKIIGALGVDGLHIRFQDRANTDNAIAMLKDLHQRYGRIFVICDNALAHKSKKMQEYLQECNGEVVLSYLPPHTPQHNPIEVQWREIKRAISCRFFKGGLDEMKTAIRELLDRGEVATVKLLDYMLAAINKAAAAA